MKRIEPANAAFAAPDTPTARFAHSFAERTEKRCSSGHQALHSRSGIAAGETRRMLKPHARTAVRHVAPHRVSGRMLDLHLLSHALYRAAWWPAMRQLSHMVDFSAFDEDDWKTAVMHGLTFGMMREHYKFQSLDYQMDQVTGAAKAGAERLLMEYLDHWNAGDEDGAYSLARRWGERRDAAEAAVRERFRQANANNSRVANDAEATARVLSDVKLACTVTVIVGCCIVTCGAAAAPMLGTAGAANALGLGFAGANFVLEEDRNKKARALGVVGSQQAWEHFADKRKEAGLDAAKRRLMDQTELLDRARRKVKQANKDLAKKMAKGGVRSATDRLAYWNKVKQAAPQGIEAAEHSVKVLEKAGKLIPIVSMVPDLIFAITDWREEQEKAR